METQQWQVSRDILTFEKKIFDNRFINLGISWDCVESVFWRARDIPYLPLLNQNDSVVSSEYTLIIIIHLCNFNYIISCVIFSIWLWWRAVSELMAHFFMRVFSSLLDVHVLEVFLEPILNCWWATSNWKLQKEIYLRYWTTILLFSIIIPYSYLGYVEFFSKGYFLVKVLDINCLGVLS